MIESDSNSPVGAPCMLMDCLRGNVGMDLSIAVPSAHKLRAFASMAEIQVRNHLLHMEAALKGIRYRLRCSISGYRKLGRLSV